MIVTVAWVGATGVMPLGLVVRPSVGEAGIMLDCWRVIESTMVAVGRSLITTDWWSTVYSLMEGWDRCAFTSMFRRETG